VKSSIHSSIVLFIVLVLAGPYGCIKTPKSANPVAPDNGFGQSLPQQCELSPEPSIGGIFLAHVFGVKKIYAAPIQAETPQEIDDPDSLDYILSIFPREILDKLLSRQFVIVGSPEVSSALATLTGVGESNEENASWLVVINGSWGCLKACYSGHPACSPCPECCDDDHGGKGPNYKYTMQ
jgi:hypothetical protein